LEIHLSTKKVIQTLEQQDAMVNKIVNNFYSFLQKPLLIKQNFCYVCKSQFIKLITTKIKFNNQITEK
jgi:hypothetical protein